MFLSENISLSFNQSYSLELVTKYIILEENEDIIFVLGLINPELWHIASKYLQFSNIR